MPDTLLNRYGGWALVTGASSGLGVSFALSLARQGFPLILTARREPRLRDLARRVEAEYGVKTCVVPLDLSTPGAASNLLEETGDREVGFLVNNAGFGYNGNFTHGEADRYERMILLNCAAPTRLSQLFLPAMIRRKRGAVLWVSSTAAFQSVPYLSVYAATKAFDLMLGEGLYGELKGTGVDVLVVCPGITRTEFALNARMKETNRGADPDDVVERALRRLGRSMTYVHGLHNKVGAFSTRLFPRKILNRILAGALPPILFGKNRKTFRRDLERKAGPDTDSTEIQDP